MLKKDKKKKGSAKGSFLQSFQNSTVQKVLIGISLVGVLTFLFPSEKAHEFSEFKVGDISTEEIIAPFTFAIQKNETDLRRERKATRDNVPPVLVHNKKLTDQKVARLDSFFSQIQELYISAASDSAKMKTVQSWNLKLTEEGLNLLVSSTAWKSDEESLEQVKNNKVDFISLDLVMPKKSGIRFYYELRKNKEWSRIPVVVVSGHHQDPAIKKEMEDT